jgi:hypothetical protein
MSNTLLPSFILFSISKVVAPLLSKIDPRYLNLLMVLICHTSVTIRTPCGIFYDAVSSSDYIVSNDGMINEL